MTRVLSKGLFASAFVGTLLVLSCEAKQESEPQAASSAAHSADGATAPASEQQPEQKLNLPHNILLILVDGLRGADMPWAGFPKDTAPRLNQLATEATAFENAYSISSTTARSVGPLLAGRYPSEMIRDGKYFTRYYDGNVMISELAREAGFTTIAVHSHAYFKSKTGVNQGFEHYEVLKGTHLNNASERNKTSERITVKARELIEQAAAQDGKWFAYLHYMDPHAPYLDHRDRPDFGKGDRGRYYKEIHFTDEWVGKLIDWVRSQAWGKRTTIVVTSDHGEAFGEHGHFKHGYLLFEEHIRVPLLVDVPGTEPRHIEHRRGHIDLTPTLAELMEIPTASFRGTSLFPEIMGALAEPRPVLAELTRDNLQNRRRAFIDENHKLIVTGDDVNFQLFDLAQDPAESQDLSESRPELLQALKKKYLDLAKGIPNREIEGPEVPLKGAPEGRRW